MDAENVLGRIIPYDVVPNGIFLDEEGVVRYKHVGGFSVDKEDHIAAVRRLIYGEAQQIHEEAGLSSSPGDALRRELSDTKFALGVEYLRQDRTEEALALLQRALELNPDNFVIRKQIWAIKYPKKFYPTIDWEWQREQLAKERSEEAKRSERCGPDGCAL